MKFKSFNSSIQKNLSLRMLVSFMIFSIPIAVHATALGGIVDNVFDFLKEAYNESLKLFVLVIILALVFGGSRRWIIAGTLTGALILGGFFFADIDALIGFFEGA